MSAAHLHAILVSDYERAVQHLYVHCSVYAKPIILSTDLRDLRPLRSAGGPAL